MKRIHRKKGAVVRSRSPHTGPDNSLTDAVVGKSMLSACHLFSHLLAGKHKDQLVTLKDIHDAINQTRKEGWKV